MSPIVSRPSSLGTPGSDRVELDLVQFKLKLEQHGYDARWSKSTLCPNRDVTRREAHRVGCTVCNGKGYVYFDPQNIRVLATSYGMQQLMMPESRYQPGTVYVSTLPEHKLSYQDKVELLTARGRFSEVLSVGAQQVAFRLKYACLGVQTVVTQAGVEIDPTSYVAMPDGTLRFASPVQASFISVSYYYHPTYILVDLLHAVRSSRITQSGLDVEAEFPTQAVGRLEFLVQDEAAT